MKCHRSGGTSRRTAPIGGGAGTPFWACAAADAARVQGGAGGGGGDGPGGEGTGIGAGFGVNARPAGAFVIRGEEVDWRPAIDVNRVILGGQLIAIAALLLARTVVKSRAARG